MNIDFIIAAYDEAHRLHATIEKLLEEIDSTDEIIVVDDGSKDGTHGVVERGFRNNAQVKLIRQNHAGRGAALRRGLLAAKADLALLTSADLVYERSFLNQIRLTMANYDMIHLSKNLSTSRYIGRPTIRMFLSRSLNISIRLLFGIYIHDTQGPKLGRTEMLKAASSLCVDDGYLFDTELAIVAKALGYRVTEVPWVLIERRGSTVRYTLIPSLIVGLLRLFVHHKMQLKNAYSKRKLT